MWEDPMDTMITVTKVVNKISGGIKSLSHRMFQSFLDDFETEYDDHTYVSWLSPGMCLERIFPMRAETFLFLSQEFPNSDF